MALRDFVFDHATIFPTILCAYGLNFSPYLFTNNDPSLGTNLQRSSTSLGDSSKASKQSLPNVISRVLTIARFCAVPVLIHDNNLSNFIPLRFFSVRMKARASRRMMRHVEDRLKYQVADWLDELGKRLSSKASG